MLHASRMRKTLVRGSVLCLLTALVEFGHSDGKARPQLLYQSVVFVHPSADPYDRSNLYGFNHAPSVIVLPDGRILCAWFSGPFEASVDQVILASYSSDQGRTWSKSEVLQDIPRVSDFDPAFISDGPRTWFFFSAGRHNRYPFVRDEKSEVGPASFRTWFRLTDDSGRTWTEPRLARERVYCRSNGIRLKGGELLLPVYESPSNTGGVLKSADGGKTWRHVGGITSPAGGGEPTIAELRSGAVMMLLRTRDGYLWRTLSRDKGESWETPRRTDLVAAVTSHNLFRLEDGRIALTHNESPPSTRTNLTIRISSDDGETWSDPLKLADATPPGRTENVWSRQVTYPSVDQLSNGDLVVVWTEISISNDEQYGDIHAAVVRIG